jgi:hypothetical protein
LSNVLNPFNDASYITFHVIEVKLGLSVINKYSKKLNEETINKFSEEIDNYTITDLEKELAFSLVNSDTSIFGADNGGIIPTNLQPTGIEAILAKYSK